VVHASWNDPALAEEAESARITAEFQTFKENNNV
jgi:hypothetical protein